MRAILLLFLCYLSLTAFSQRQASDEYLQSRKEEIHKEMKLQLRQYLGEDSDQDDIFEIVIPRVPEWIIKKMQKQINIFDTLTHYSKENIAKAEYTLGCYYHEQKIRDTAAFKWFMRAAQFGQRDAQFNIGLVYEYGSHNHSKDVAQAIKWYEKAAEQGSPEAMLNLGAIYYNGKYVKEDFLKGFDYLRSSAEKGNAEAMVNLATIYDEGVCVTRDVKLAISYWLNAAEKGEYKCYAFVGDRYLKGDGVKRDKKKAFGYFEQGHQQEDIKATCRLAHCYYSGQGVRKNYRQALSLIRSIDKEQLWDSGCFTNKELDKLYKKTDKE